MRQIILLGSLVLLISTTVLCAEPITLQWSAPTLNSDQSPLTDLCCYIVYWGTTSGSYPNSLNVGNVTVATIGGLNPALIYYFVVTAKDTSDNESVVSVEISGRARRVVHW